MAAVGPGMAGRRSIRSRVSLIEPLLPVAGGSFWEANRRKYSFLHYSGNFSLCNNAL